MTVRVVVRPVRNPARCGIWQTGNLLQIISPCCGASVYWEYDTIVRCTNCRETFKGYSNTTYPANTWGEKGVTNWAAAWLGLPEEDVKVTIE